MNIKAIIASLVLGSSSVAMAAPSVAVTVRGSVGTTVVRDHRDDSTSYPARTVYRPVYRQPVRTLPVRTQPVYSPPIWQSPAPRSVTLGSGIHFANDGRTSITVGSQYGQFGTLQLSAAGGRAYIEQVYVEFDNGQEQVIRALDRTLTGDQTLTLDLDGSRRGIRRVVVYGKEINGGIRRADGAFTLTAM